MIAVDSSTLILLAKTTILDLFIGNFAGKIFISEGVEEESLAKESFDAKLIEKRIKEKKITVKKTKNRKAVVQIMKDFNLELGEAETIGLCLENKWVLVGTDDKNAIKACIIMEIIYATALDILVTLNKKNILAKDDAIEKIGKLSKFGWYKGDIILDAKNSVR